ncbi:HAD-IA family hydrolase [Paenarthrobacter sp. YJN-5]|uniref:HAD-IA family hydrolase n=1 Tax=Paenarthrobacter sp. YJN-5 TaxID=2735316 RepID=UPI001878C547|nr:HAD-IA family hydrolase [Paenarthrobacter sp. YJN-5]QOT17310.1 HAD-IA family hydrolase [Paenarthrobacter sp. YJN-5]
MKKSPTAAAAAAPYDAVILDLDGVVTNTALVHLAAWKEAYEAIINDPRYPKDGSRAPFTPDDYYALVDGKPREQGLIGLMASRGVDIPPGTPQDAGGDWTAVGLGAWKNKAYLRRLQEGGVQIFPGTGRFLENLKDAGVATALVTSSRNATPVLAAANLLDSFSVVIDGRVAASHGLAGKPAPDTFLEAARRLDVSVRRAVVVEDAVAGVLAASRGGFGLVVGVDRHGNRADLEAAGADVVINNLAELDLGLVMRDPWLLIYEGMDPEHEGHREALTTLGNGYMGIRGAVTENRRPGRYAGTYLAGVYNRVWATIGEGTVAEEHMVNLPDCLPLDLRLEGTPWWSGGGLEILHERRVLNMEKAVLTRHLLLEAPDGRHLHLEETRFVSMDTRHILAIRTRLTPRDWSGLLDITAGVNCLVRNSNLPEPALSSQVHLIDRTIPPSRDAGPVLAAEVETTQSQVRVAIAAAVDVSGSTGVTESRAGFHFRSFQVRSSEENPVTVDRIIAISTSRDRAASSAATSAAAALAGSGGDFEELMRRHKASWRRVLRPFKVQLDAPVQVQLVLNLHLFHLLQTLTPHTAELDVGVPARGLHGEGYRGHVFWDELFVLPVLNPRMPEVSKALLDYRWRRLPAARRAAVARGLSGALFPWQSGSDGTEETPDWLYNPRSGQWVPDYSHLQVHAGLAVAFNAWQYFESTNDVPWLLGHGAELLIDVARCFASLAVHDPGHRRYHIRGVAGPDEYHTWLPGRDVPGLDDNAYTNVMAAWVCGKAAEVTSMFPGHEQQELLERLGVGKRERAHWRRLSRAMYVPFNKDGLISQFEGYDLLRELDWDGYRQEYDNIERLDLILGAEGDDVNRYKLAKQADVLMLPYLLGGSGLIAMLHQLGYRMTEAQLARTVEYYLARTAHGSTLSRVAHASVLAAVDPDRAWESYREALDADLDDTQHGTTKAGIHLGAMAGTVDVIQRSFAGLRMDRSGITFTPNMPHGLNAVSFTVTTQGHWLGIELTTERIRVTSSPGSAPPLRIQVRDQTLMLPAGESRSFRLQAGSR